MAAKKKVLDHISQFGKETQLSSLCLYFLKERVIIEKIDWSLCMDLRLSRRMKLIQLGRFPYVRSGRPKTAMVVPASFNLKKVQGARVHFSATTLQILRFGRELSSSDLWVAPFRPEPILRTRGFHYFSGTYWSDRPERINRKRP